MEEQMVRGAIVLTATVLLYILFVGQLMRPFLLLYIAVYSLLSSASMFYSCLEEK